ncbi:hypothetical protein [uncultured Massilia sp.]|uniref:hypothetical protein n=1 Tax=uncultured Massilia sp. TaxID=169973 RepID=UPI0025F97AB6|nr:hypothetical protein [uncultured Massilia sp.]
MRPRHIDASNNKGAIMDKTSGTGAKKVRQDGGKEPGPAWQLAGEALCLYADPGYRPPGPEDVRTVMHLLGTTAEELALLVGVKNGRAVRRWLAPPSARSHAQIDYATWRLMLLEAGLVEPPKPLMHAKAIRSKRPILNLTGKQSATSPRHVPEDRQPDTHYSKDE